MKIGHVALALGALAFSACSLPNDLNLNNPSQNDFSTIADLPHLQALVSGVVRGDRAQNENEIIYGETIGRDGMRLTGSEPRFVTELLGPSTIDPSDFLGGAGSGFDVDLLVRNLVPVQKALGFAAIRTPKGGINDQLHARVLMQDGDVWHI